VPPPNASSTVPAQGVFRKFTAVAGLEILIVGLVWFAHLAFSLEAYLSTIAAMGIGLLLVITASVSWSDAIFRILRHFRRR
jgi:hypothetical protein